MASSKIEWCDVVWNPVTGCTKVSPGCAHCYAERMAKRLAGRFGYPADDPFKVTLHPIKLMDPGLLVKPRRIFVNSMSDLFHKDVPDSFIAEVFNRMMFFNQHTFIVLTKRAERMQGWVSAHFKFPVPNIWLGISVENQRYADERIPLLLQTPAAVRFVSVEPMLGRIDLSEGLASHRPSLNWVICGGESGPGARPHPPLIDVRYLKIQCIHANVPFFLKQMWGHKMPELDGRVWDQMPEVR